MSPTRVSRSFGKSNVIRDGTDLSIVRVVNPFIPPAGRSNLEEKHKVSAEVVDLRSIRPLDTETILASVRKTNRVLLSRKQTVLRRGCSNAFLIQIKLSITLTLQSRGFPPLTPPKLTARRSKTSRYQIMIESIAKLWSLYNFLSWLLLSICPS